jgi:hypothetical protein
MLALHLLQHAQHHFPPRRQQPTGGQGQQQHGACLAANRAFTMRMEQHKVQRIVSKVQVTDPP